MASPMTARFLQRTMAGKRPRSEDQASANGQAAAVGGGAGQTRVLGGGGMDAAAAAAAQDAALRRDKDVSSVFFFCVIGWPCRAVCRTAVVLVKLV